MAAAVEGFDWDDPAGLWEKLDEEVGELRAAATPAERAEELGDLLFMLVNLARHLGLDCAGALDAACGKFERRFQHIMANAQSLPPLGHPDRLAAMERLWAEAKRRERGVGTPAARRL